MSFFGKSTEIASFDLESFCTNMHVLSYSGHAKSIQVYNWNLKDNMLELGQFLNHIGTYGDTGIICIGITSKNAEQKTNAMW